MKRKTLRNYIAATMVCLSAVVLVACTSESVDAQDASETTGEILAASSAYPKAEGEGYDSPEDAAEAYLMALKDADLNRMLSTFAVESYVENLDYEALLNRMKTYNPSYEHVEMPSANAFMKALNLEKRRSNITTNIMQQYLILCGSDFDFNEIVRLEDEAAVSAFVAQMSGALDDTKLSSIELLGFAPPEELSEHYMQETNQETMKSQAKPYGSEQISSCAAVFEMDGVLHMLCLDAILYEDKWYVFQFQGNIGALIGIASDMQGLAVLGNEYNKDEIKAELMQ